MADFKPSKTQLNALSANGWSLLDVAQSVTKKSFHRNSITGEGKLSETFVAEHNVDFSMVKEFLTDRHIIVDGRKWYVAEPQEMEDGDYAY